MPLCSVKTHPDSEEEERVAPGTSSSQPEPNPLPKITFVRGAYSNISTAPRDRVYSNMSAAMRFLRASKAATTRETEIQ